MVLPAVQRGLLMTAKAIKSSHTHSRSPSSSEVFLDSVDDTNHHTAVGLAEEHQEGPSRSISLGCCFTHDGLFTLGSLLGT